MDSQPPKLHIFFFPYIMGGHLIPMIDVARVFASHGVKSTIVTTPHNALLFQNPIHRDQELGHDISFHTLNFPAEEFGLPEGCENELTTNSTIMLMKLHNAVMKLQDQLEQLLRETKPDCLVSDGVYPLTADVANGLGIPRIVFDGTGCFSHCIKESLRRYVPYEKVASDTEAFVLPGLPDKIELKKSMLPEYAKNPNHVFALSLKAGIESELRSYGAVVNSFQDLEIAYADFYEKEMGRKVWQIGPVSLCNKSNMDKIDRGIKVSIDEYTCLNWLDSREHESVLYISFGSLPRLSRSQLLEIAYGLEASDHPFIWVVGRVLKSSDGEVEEEELLPVGFEERVMKSKKGLIIQGWAPQLLILEHPAVGAFMNHCGWNSIMEGVSAGVPMITWPLGNEQFYNERLIIDVLKVGISIGYEDCVDWRAPPRVIVERDRVTKAVNRLLGSTEEIEVVEIRKQAKEFEKKAKRAVEKGGSSYNNIVALIKELKSLRKINEN